MPRQRSVPPLSVARSSGPAEDRSEAGASTTRQTICSPPPSPSPSPPPPPAPTRTRASGARSGLAVTPGPSGKGLRDRAGVGVAAGVDIAQPAVVAGGRVVGGHGRE